MGLLASLAWVRAEACPSSYRSPVGTVVQVSGTGFDPNDTACVISMEAWGLTIQTCAISGGIVTGSFSVPMQYSIGSFRIWVTAAPVADEAQAIFLVVGSPTTTTTATAAQQTGTTLIVTTVTQTVAGQSFTWFTRFFDWLRCWFLGLVQGHC